MTGTPRRLVELMVEGGPLEPARGVGRWARHRITDVARAAMSEEYRTELCGEDIVIEPASGRHVFRAKSMIGEEPIVEYLLAESRTGDVYWDVGCNIGIHSCVAGSKGLEVHAFDPHPTALHHASVNLGRNEIDAVLYPVALSDEHGVSRFGGEIDATSSMNGDGFVVATVRGDDLIGTVVAPDYVKIDVEGDELAVIRGMLETIGGAAGVMVEVHDPREIKPIKRLLEALDHETTRMSANNRKQMFVVGRRS